MNDDENLEQITRAGWCCPTESFYDFRATRGGITFSQIPTTLTYRQKVGVAWRGLKFRVRVAVRAFRDPENNDFCDCQDS